MSRLRMFPSRLARRVCIFLFVMVTCLGLVSLLVYDQYLSKVIHRPKQQELVHNFVQTVLFVHALSASEEQESASGYAKQWPLILRFFSGRGFRVTYVDKVPEGVPSITDFDPQSLAKLYSDQGPRVRVAIKLVDQHWVIVAARATTFQWLALGFILIEVVMGIFLFGLCFWAVRKLSVPVDDIVTATERFGIDIHAPPLAEQGSQEVITLINAFNQMQAKIRRLVMDRTDMLAAISHDLRTPITRLQLRVESMQDQVQAEKAVKDLQEMERMISSILSFSRDYMSKEPMEYFDLNALVESCCDDLIDMDKSVDYISQQLRIPFYGRMSPIRRAISNVIENAIKYGQHAVVELIMHDDKVQVRVQDDGPGINEAEFENVFKPFYRVDPARSPSIGGSGLGLAVTRDVVRAHGGDVVLCNRQSPAGLLVCINLPVSQQN